MSQYSIASLLGPTETKPDPTPTPVPHYQRPPTLSPGSLKRPPTPMEPYVRKSLKRGDPDRASPEPTTEGARLRINSRERRRMHDLNSAMDALRQCLPYASSPSVRKLSKIATLVLARNHILHMNQTILDLQKEKILAEVRLAQAHGLVPPFVLKDPQGPTTSREQWEKMVLEAKAE